MHIKLYNVSRPEKSGLKMHLFILQNVAISYSVIAIWKICKFFEFLIWNIGTYDVMLVTILIKNKKLL